MRISRGRVSNSSENGTRPKICTKNKTCFAKIETKMSHATRWQRYSAEIKAHKGPATILERYSAKKTHQKTMQRNNNDTRPRGQLNISSSAVPPGRALSPPSLSATALVATLWSDSSASSQALVMLILLLTTAPSQPLRASRLSLSAFSS